jgi:hypothetical protein
LVLSFKSSFFLIDWHADDGRDCVPYLSWIAHAYLVTCHMVYALIWILNVLQRPIYQSFPASLWHYGKWWNV